MYSHRYSTLDKYYTFYNPHKETKNKKSRKYTNRSLTPPLRHIKSKLRRLKLLDLSELQVMSVKKQTSALVTPPLKYLKLMQSK